MARGLDLYQRYNKVKPNGFRTARDAGYEFAIMKLTDGFGQANVAGDVYVGAARNAGFAVGGYHFAQKGQPVRQAQVFGRELERLHATDIMSFLDIENNTGIIWGADEAHNFVQEFCRELLNWVPRVGVYANTSELRNMRAQLFPADYGIWEANYGSNTGVRNSLPANSWAPRRVMHQFTSNGSVPGFEGRIDINESFVDLSMEEDMALSESDVSRLAQAVWAMQIPNLNPGEGRPDSLPAGVLQYGTNMGAWGGIDEENETQAQLAAAVDRLENKFTGLLTAQQAALLAAFDARPTNISMTDANVQQLLAGMDATTVKAFRRVATAMLADTEEEN